MIPGLGRTNRRSHETVPNDCFRRAVDVWRSLTQKLETQKADPAKVIRVETAKDRLTVIELADAVTMVAVGNRSAFTVERQEQGVRHADTDESARTNLFISTSGGRYSYELVPAASVEQMHFAIDEPTAPVVAAAISAPPIPPERIPSAMLTEAIPVLVTGERDTSGRVEVAIRDLYRRDHRLYLRYAFINRTIAFSPCGPRVRYWKARRLSSRSSRPPSISWESENGADYQVDGETAIEILDADQVPLISPGGQGWGWLVVNDISSPAPDTVSVLKMQFAADSKGTVDAFLVLSPAPASEVARARRPVE